MVFTGIVSSKVQVYCTLYKYTVQVYCVVQDSCVLQLFGRTALKMLNKLIFLLTQIIKQILLNCNISVCFVSLQ